MARIRYIKPEFFEDVRVATVSIEARLLYIALWCFMDRVGVTEADPQLIKRRVFPYDEEVNFKKIEKLVKELEKSQHLIRVHYSDKDYLFCPTFERHQKFHFKEQFRHPIPLEILGAHCKPGASPVLAQGEPGASRLGIGMGMGIRKGIGIGMGRGTGKGTENENSKSGEFHSSLEEMAEDPEVKAGQAKLLAVRAALGMDRGLS
jgi:hypothetical protein